MRNRARVTCLQYAPMGALPYLTWAVVERHLPALAHTLVVPLASVYVHVGDADCYFWYRIHAVDAVQKTAMCLRTFCTLPADASTLLSFTDAAAARSLTGHNDVNSCAVWAYSGKQKVCVCARNCTRAQVTPIEYARCVRVLRPTFAQLPIDTDVFACATADNGAGGKRMLKAVESTRAFSEQVLAELMSSTDGDGDAGAVDGVNGNKQQPVSRRRDHHNVCSDRHSLLRLRHRLFDS